MSKAVRKKAWNNNLKTPIRSALKPTSALQNSVKDGLGALLNKHYNCVEKFLRSKFTDSLDIDEGLKSGREQENRWDYLLGHKDSGQIIAVEPHSANSGEVDTVIKKRQAALLQLKDHLRDGRHISKWIWVASGNVQLYPLGKLMLQLDQNGITFAGKMIMR